MKRVMMNELVTAVPLKCLGEDDDDDDDNDDGADSANNDHLH